MKRQFLIIFFSLLTSAFSAKAAHQVTTLTSYTKERGFSKITVLADEASETTRIEIDLQPKTFLKHFDHAFTEDRVRCIAFLKPMFNTKIKALSVDLGEFNTKSESFRVSLTVPDEHLVEYEIWFSCSITSEDVPIIGGQTFVVSLSDLKKASQSASDDKDSVIVFYKLSDLEALVKAERLAKVITDPNKPQSAISETTDRSDLIVVRAKIVSMPKDFEFPGSSDADGKEQTVKPQKAHSSELQIITPNELVGKNITFYHLPPLAGQTVWHQVGTIIEFQIDRESLGSMYPPKDRRHTFKIPYVHNIVGEIAVIQKAEAEQNAE